MADMQAHGEEPNVAPLHCNNLRCRALLHDQGTIDSVDMRRANDGADVSFLLDCYSHRDCLFAYVLHFDSTHLLEIRWLTIVLYFVCRADIFCGMCHCREITSGWVSGILI